MENTALGQFAGYLFQPEKALYYLTTLSKGQFVSIELIDDVSIHSKDGTVILTEQDKHSISQSSKTFSNGSKDLWRTLEIWISKIKNKILSVDNCKFVCATNKIIPSNYIIVKISECTSESESEKIIMELKEIENKKKLSFDSKEKIPASSKKLHASMSYVISEIEILKKLLVKVKINDGEDLNSLNEELLDKLYIPETNQDKLKILNHLRGWLSTKCRQLILHKREVKIYKEDFNKIVNETYDSFKLSQISFTAKSQIEDEIEEEEIENIKNNTFVAQLKLLKHRNIKKMTLNAIIDFLCYQKEIINIAELANITDSDFKTFNKQNKEKWETIFDSYVINEIDSYNEENLNEMAVKIYSDIQKLKIKFKDIYEIPISSEYFKNGSFHSLADKLEIGWHPNWQKMLMNE